MLFTATDIFLWHCFAENLWNRLSCFFQDKVIYWCIYKHISFIKNLKYCVFAEKLCACHYILCNILLFISIFFLLKEKWICRLFCHSVIPKKFVCVPQCKYYIDDTPYGGGGKHIWWKMLLNTDDGLFKFFKQTKYTCREIHTCETHCAG